LPSIDEHIAQAQKNFNFLAEVNKQIAQSVDWQVTVCFYTALHLVNSHLSRHHMQYRKHFDVNHALNPDVAISVTKLPEDEYDAYIALQSLSRRSRYLVNQKDGNIGSEDAFFTYDKHLCKAVRHLNKLIVYFTEHYQFTFPKINFNCTGLKAEENLRHFSI
jgi:hypothetical protein